MRSGPAVGAILVALAACAAPRAGAPVLSRDERSQAFCILLTKSSGDPNLETLASCGLRERWARSHARRLNTNPLVDGACEDVATYGKRGGPFSWVTYSDCVNHSI
ncbi:MAG: hypothetical protein QOK29_3887 [Rhodospirillaceae bacterium]|jgi:hypothetical protein|nr:hypothetical protein [Rhodospirillaceae bacterium]